MFCNVSIILFVCYYFIILFVCLFHYFGEFGKVVNFAVADINHRYFFESSLCHTFAKLKCQIIDILPNTNIKISSL